MKKHTALINKLKEIKFSIEDGKALLVAPMILVRVIAENGNHKNLVDVHAKLDGCVLSTALKESASHAFEHLNGLDSPDIKAMYAHFDINTDQGVSLITQSTLDELRSKLIEIHADLFPE
jgi:hypothetical protein